MKYFKSKTLIIIIVTLILIVTIGLTFNPLNSVNWIGNIISIPFTSVEKLFSYTGQQIEGGINMFNDVEKLRAENKVLSENVDKLNNERTEYLRLKRENEELRKVIKLKDQLEDYEFVGVNVIARDSGNFFNVFATDKGSTSGIAYNMPVVTSKGLVGKVIEAQPFSSKIMSIIEEGSSISAVVVKSGDTVVVKGESKLAKDGLCRLNYIPAELDLVQGDEIETSGFGGIYPKGLIIGKVKEIRQGESAFDKYAIIEPAADLKRLSQLTILKKVSEDEPAQKTKKKDASQENNSNESADMETIDK